MYRGSLRATGMRNPWCGSVTTDSAAVIDSMYATLTRQQRPAAAQARQRAFRVILP